MLEPVATRAPASEAALELGLLQQYLGNAQTASQLLDPVYRQAGDSSDQLSLFRAARAAVALGRLREANSLYRAASAAGFDPSVETGWGLLFFQTYSVEAIKSFQAVLKEDAEWAPAHLGLARTLAEDDPPAAAKEAARALEIDPELADAELFLADLELDNTKYDAARARIERVLARNPA